MWDDQFHLNVSSYTSLLRIALPSALCAVLLVRAALPKKSTKPPLPPGPKPLPIVGNALDIPIDKPSKKYAQWAKEYNSDIVHLGAFGNHFIILHNLEDVEELYERRAATYSDRPPIHTLELVGFGYNVAFMRAGARWKLRRQYAQQAMRAEAVRELRPLQEKSMNEMLIGLLETPHRFEEHHHRLIISLPLGLMYNYTPSLLRDPAVDAAVESFEVGMKVISPEGSMANVFPSLRHVPWTWTQRLANETQRLGRIMKRGPLSKVQDDVSKGAGSSSLLGQMMEKKGLMGLGPDEEDAWFDVAHTMQAGGSHMTISAAQTFFYLIATHPDVQAKAQKELDNVLGSHPRLPNLDDRPSLPYIEAIYREVLRWAPSAPMGAPRVAPEEEVYKGFLIPKGSIIMANIWSITHDERRYTDPLSFNPDRFFDEEGRLNGDDRVLAYGFGRRLCVGRYLASNTLWLMMATILASFSIRPKTDAEGREIPIDDDFEEGGFITQKTPFQCDITPRSAEWRDVLENIKTSEL
ncbi:hypothetical protein CVT24_005213 [Panaeolus cyanescens]|uniref:Cytochrome P450 n=1 Tax=Panaeolus cyanescens TaxID=181874 RepID=A0A409Y915_9AGAR|nr:hypothetical protein CVT24_005213 [Panaeolus cyanescens]